jgi:hypothetical protein
MGFVLNFAYFMCTKINSPLTTTVIGCLKNVVTTYCGMLFNDYRFSALNFVGLNVSVFGSLMYSHAEFTKVSKQKVDSPGSRSCSPPPSVVGSGTSACELRVIPLKYVEVTDPISPPKSPTNRSPTKFGRPAT